MTHCPTCHDTGHVCENHPHLPWGGIAQVIDGGAITCDCGAGMPCPACCSPIPEDGTHRIGEAFVPDHLRSKSAGVPFT